MIDWFRYIQPLANIIAAGIQNVFNLIVETWESFADKINRRYEFATNLKTYFDKSKCTVRYFYRRLFYFIFSLPEN